MAYLNAVPLAENLAADSSSTAVTWPGGALSFMSKATFGGGSVKLEYQLPDASTWVTLATHTAAGITRVEGVPPGPIRVTTVTASAAYAWAILTG